MSGETSSKFPFDTVTIPIDEIKEDEEFKSLLPPNNSYEELEKSIQENSQADLLSVDINNVLIDGYTRLAIMKKQGFKEVKVKKYLFDSRKEREKAYELIWMLNGARRHLDKNQKLALYVKIADLKAKLKASKNNTEESKILVDRPEFISQQVEKSDEAEKYVTLEDGTVINASDYERILNEIDQEYHALSDTDKRRLAILRIKADWLLKYVTDQRFKAPLNQVFRVYIRAKELGVLDKIKSLPPVLRDPLIATTEGRKIILEDEYRDLLFKILNKEYTTDRAISEVKLKEAEKKRRKMEEEEVKKEEETPTEQGGTEASEIVQSKTKVNETETEGKITETVNVPEVSVPQTTQTETVAKKVEEATKVPEVKAEVPQTEVKEEPKEKKTEKRKKEELPPTKLEIHVPKPDLESLYRAMPSVKRLVDEGRLTEEDAEKIYEIWRNMEAIYKQASLLWYNTVDRVLQKAGVPEKEREDMFYEMTRQYCRLFSREEVFPKEVLEGRW